MSVWVGQRHEGGAHGKNTGLQPVQGDVTVVCRLGVDRARLRPNVRDGVCRSKSGE